MKMKEACRATSLTERAIRLYLAKDLLTPVRQGGILYFSNDDIRTLKDIAALRRCDFSLEQISDMLKDASAIPVALQRRIDEAEAKIAHERDVLNALREICEQSVGSVGEFVSLLEARSIVPPMPNFAQFDEMSEEARQQQAQAAVTGLAHAERRKRRVKALVLCGSALVLLTCIFLSYTRLAGFIPLSPITLLNVGPGDAVTVSLGSEWAVDMIGRDTITVHIADGNLWGRQLIKEFSEKSNQIIERGAQLSVNLTNLELIRIGVNPLRQFPAGAARDEWRRMVVRALFAENPVKSAELWLLESPNQPPLFTKTP